ncbi:hypothetical protein ElyMa_004020100 [Elysia marginata]|uniref:Uncharacterized protein n=1 Tax=Elysia marginata TaxID=1093978 RepID=A0AAV4G155_9GAST|nr:hypothetical protein ElyMa_004020100 [Elysia marginata]
MLTPCKDLRTPQSQKEIPDRYNHTGTTWIGVRLGMTQPGIQTRTDFSWTRTSFDYEKLHAYLSAGRVYSEDEQKMKSK